MHSRQLDTKALLEAVAQQIGSPEAGHAHWASEGAASALTFEGVEVRSGEMLALGAGGGDAVWLSWTKDDAELLILELRGFTHEHARELLLGIANRTFEVVRGDVFVRVGHSKHWIGHEVVLQRHGVLG